MGGIADERCCAVLQLLAAVVAPGGGALGWGPQPDADGRFPGRIRTHPGFFRPCGGDYQEEGPHGLLMRPVCSLVVVFLEHVSVTGAQIASVPLTK